MITDQKHNNISVKFNEPVYMNAYFDFEISIYIKLESDLPHIISEYFETSSCIFRIWCNLNYSKLKKIVFVHKANEFL